MKARHGKIARLPKEIREQLNRRMENGWRGARLVKWLNELPPVSFAPPRGAQAHAQAALKSWSAADKFENHAESKL